MKRSEILTWDANCFTRFCRFGTSRNNAPYCNESHMIGNAVIYYEHPTLNDYILVPGDNSTI